MAKAGAKIFPFLWYAKEAEQAAKFYASIFPDSRIDRVTTMQSESPSGPPGSVKVVDFTLFGQPFQAMTAGRPGPVLLEIPLDVQRSEGAQTSHRPVPPPKVPAGCSPQEIDALIARAKMLLGWTPTVSLDDGLQRTVAAFRAEVSV